MLRGIEEMEAELDAGGNAGMQDFCYALRNILMVIRNPCSLEEQ